MLNKITALSFALAAWLFLPLACAGDPAGISGGGNFTTGDDEAVARAQFAALRAAGAEAIRINVYPANYYDGQKPVPEKMEQQILQAHREGVKTITLLFEFDGAFRRDPDPPNRLGGYDKWHSIGRAFAERFSPNSAWLKSQGVSDWGVTIFQAFNEPDGQDRTDALPITGPSSYYTSLKGLADGVHSVSPSLAVVPGGFTAENDSGDPTLRGYGTALAPLWNDGTLAGIDLHTYNDISYAPIIDKDGSAVFDFSPQANFDAVKKACHITRDIPFYTSEYSFKANDQGIDESLAAKRLLTCIWANLGVVGNDGKTSATRLALVWNLFNPVKDDATYGMNTGLDPWTPTARGRTFQMVMSLTKDMRFLSLDPKGRGEFVLEGAGKKLWVWQNYPNWTDTPGASFTVSDIPASATKLDVLGWDGPRKSIPLKGQSSCTVTGLPANETLMFVATPDPVK